MAVLVAPAFFPEVESHQMSLMRFPLFFGEVWGMLRRACLFSGVFACWCAALSAEEPKVDFAAQVRPLLMKYCSECHGAKEQKSGFRADLGSALLEGGNSGKAIEPGKPDESLLVKSLLGGDDVIAMPPKDPKPSKEEIELIRKWIAEGASVPPDEPPATEEKVKSSHWSFQPIQRAALPEVNQKEWVRNPIDQFVLAKLEAQGMRPSPEADRTTLLRRASLDLTGLPPTIEELDAYLNDKEPGAYERAVDRLLGSVHYGEHLGRQWLDLARYADSNGFTIDSAREIWKYREWVIGALNQDMPFDQFTVEQIAGDMLPNATMSQQIATGFHRNTLINEEGGTDDEQFRVESVVDRVGTTGSVFLGLTVACSQCHDHKYDPISQREFYQFFAFFNGADEPKLEVPTQEQLAAGDWERAQELRQQLAEERKKFAEQRDAFREAAAAWMAQRTTEERRKLPEMVVVVLNMPLEKRGDADWKYLTDHYQTIPEAAEKFPVLKTIADLNAKIPQFQTTLIMRERAEPRPTFVHVRGDFLRQGAAVEPLVPAVLHSLPKPEQERKYNRLDLGRWLVAAENPLTARVTVNRLWQQVFGRGIVETENDFGTQGTPPSHPELLDWLAMEFQQPTILTGTTLNEVPLDRPWGIKRLLRLIVCSATYRQSSRQRPEYLEKDPRNIFLARQNRLRIPAEGIRDAALTASGLLSRKLGGPSVFPPQPEGVFDLTQVKKTWPVSEGENRYRRAMYTYLWRSSPYPGLTVFDFPEANVACTRRNRSNTPLQALTLANDQVFLELSRGMAERALKEGGVSDQEKIDWVFRRSLSRSPDQDERQRLQTFVRETRSLFALDQPGAVELLGGNAGEPATITERAVWTSVCRAIMNLDEFITRE